MRLNVYLTDDGRAFGAYVEQSTLGNRAIEACMVAALRTTSWPAKVEPVAAVNASPASKLFFAQPAPVVEPPIFTDRPSGIYPKAVPEADPGGTRIPRIFVIPFSPIVAAAVVFGIVYFWSYEDAPAWVSELNPITQQPYTSLAEYHEVRRLSPQEIQQLRQAHIKATQSQPPPAPSPAPAPTLSPQEQREQEKKAQKCANIAAKIKEIIEAKRDATPNGGFPQGRKGIAERWREFAENKGKWGRKPDGSLEKKPQNHLKEYEKGQYELIQELVKWKGCDPKDLPRLAHEYATQKPELGPGKPLEPKPNPPSSAPVSPIGNTPKDRKRSE
jgi:hypothetical protein